MSILLPNRIFVKNFQACLSRFQFPRSAHLLRLNCSRYTINVLQRILLQSFYRQPALAEEDCNRDCNSSGTLSKDSQRAKCVSDVF